MLPSVGFFLQLFVSHLVRMVSVTDLATVSVILGGLTADVEQVNSIQYSSVIAYGDNVSNTCGVYTYTYTLLCVSWCCDFMCGFQPYSP